MTVSDTTSLIGRAAISLNPSHAGKVDEAMDGCVKAYLDDLRAFQNGVSADNSGQQTSPGRGKQFSEGTSGLFREAQDGTDSASEERIQAKICELDAAKEIERRSFLRVRATALGIPTVDESNGNHHVTGIRNITADWPRLMREAGAAAIRDNKLQIRDPEGLRALLQWVDSDKQRTDYSESDRGNSGANSVMLDWIIVSVSFSREFILGAMIEAGLVSQHITDGESDLAGETIDKIREKIWCNELLADELPKKSRERDNKELNLIQTAGDKMRTMESAVKLRRRRPEDDDASDASHETKTVYIGDSTTDLGCILSTDLGVIMRDIDAASEKDKLRLAVQGLGIECPHILQAQGHDRLNRHVCWTGNFRDVLSWLQQIAVD